MTIAQSLFMQLARKECNQTTRVHGAGARLVSQAIRIFPRGAHARGKGGGGREGKIRLVTCARFLFRLPECWQSQSNFSIQSN